MIVKTYYRFYTDDWGITSHTADIEVPVKITPFLSVSPFYRFYTQSAANYFAPYGQHDPSENYFTSDYDLSKFNSHYAGVNFRIVPANGVFGISHLNSLELRYGHYMRDNGLRSDQVTLHLQFK